MENVVKILKNYISGKYPLVKTFWLGMLSCYIPLLMSVMVVAPFFIFPNKVAFLLLLLSKLLYGLYYPLAIIFPIATFNASKKYTGMKIWSVLAIIYSILLAISAIWALTK